MNPIPPFNKLFDSINTALSESDLAPELQQKFRTLLQSTLAKMDLVTREEFDAQCKVLQQTRLKLESLEQTLHELSASVEEDRSGPESFDKSD